MADCIFCKIISREIDAKRVYEDENNLAFLDIRPAAKGHTIVIPKYHAVTIYDLPEENIASLSIALKRVAMAIKKSLEPHGITIAQNNEKAAGQVIDHFHFHVVPRTYEDGGIYELKEKPEVQVTEEEQKKIRKKIAEAMAVQEKPKKEDPVHNMLDRIDANLKELDDVLK